MDKHPLYIQLYNHYKDLISLGVLKPGSKLPSIRKCANERMISKTTVEGAYLQLVAEGYISSRPGSGFYVSSLDYEDIAIHRGASYAEDYEKSKVIYDFASANVDYKTFNFSLWSKYIKHALRNEKRLISYGEPQGEYDLRVAICDYIEESRGVLCSPHQVIVGAGIQSLLHILCSLISHRDNVAFVNGSFNQGGAIFDDRGFKSIVYNSVDDNLYSLKEENIKLIYTSPSHTTPWGDVMPINTRLRLLNFAKQEDALIIEDDYDSEFRYYGRPVPSLQGLDGGEKVIYMGTFSKLLLPSLRISFMVLPINLLDLYKNKAHLYNQTASKTEQIALCNFIKDGHLKRQIKKSRKIYMTKSKFLCNCINDVFDGLAIAIPGAGGFLIEMKVENEVKRKPLFNKEAIEEDNDILKKWFIEKCNERGILIKDFYFKSNKNKPLILLSCSGVSSEEFYPAMKLLKEIIVKYLSPGDVIQVTGTCKTM